MGVREERGPQRNRGPEDRTPAPSCREQVKLGLDQQGQGSAGGSSTQAGGPWGPAGGRGLRGQRAGPEVAQCSSARPPSGGWGGKAPSRSQGPRPPPSSLCCPSERLLHPQGLRQDPPLLASPLSQGPGDTTAESYTPGEWERQTFVISPSGAQSPESTCRRASLLPRLLGGPFLWLQLLVAPEEHPETPSAPHLCPVRGPAAPLLLPVTSPSAPASQSLVTAFRAHLESPG